MTRRSLLIGLAGAVGLATAGWGQPAAPARADAMTFALTGDSIITRRLSVYQEPDFLGLLEVIRNADVAFTNLEMLFHDYEPYPAHQSGGTYMRAEPELARELVWAGFDLVSFANNHTGDFGPLGMQLTLRHARAAGLVGAGAGNSLPEAREAKFLETGKARVALVACASTFPDHSRASRSRGDMPARPGLSPLRYSTTYTVTPVRLEALRGALREAGVNVPAEGPELRVFGTRFVAGDTPGARTEPHAGDLAEIAAVVRNASRLADYTLVSIHAHEGGRSRFEPAEFLVTFARAMIDAGADIFVGHGPHVLRGIEIYKGRPILYSLGDFIFQNETVLRLPQENYEPYDLGPDAHVADFNDRRYDHDTRGFPADPPVWESVVAVPAFRGRQLDALVLHPITLGHGQPRTERGRPRLAGPDLGRRIIEDLARLSRPFGTVVEWDGSRGVVRLAGSTSQP